MKFVYDEDAKKFISNESITEITVSRLVPTMCCGSGKPEAIVHKGKPKMDKDVYEVYKDGNIDIYVDKFLDFPDHEIKFGLEKYLLLKNLVVKNY